MSDPTDLADLVLDHHQAHSPGRRLVVLVDGGSGSGKTTLAQRLVTDLQQRLHQSVQLISLDDCYPGWSGLAAGSQQVPGMLDPDDPHHLTWDWERHQTSGRTNLDPAAPTIIEGCGSLTPTNRALATVGIWCDLDAATRKQRALERDGDGFRPWWNLWEAQEVTHWRSHRPRSLADLVVQPTWW